MEKALISVIVPVYNAESSINRCIESILAQTYENIEVILINDGSTDSSLAICRNFADRDSRVRVIDQPNRGVAMARQAGIDIAEGTYSIHTDPDDWIEPTMLEEMYVKATGENADMVICDFMIDFADRSKHARQKVRKRDSVHCLNQMMYGRIHGSLCNKLIRTDLYRQHDIRFFDGLNYCEDFLTCAQMFIKGIKISYIPKALYHYDQIVNTNSATRRHTKSTLKIQFRFYKKLREILGKNPPKELSHTISVIAYDCYYNKTLSSGEFAETFRKHRKDFLKSKLKLKRRAALYLAASGHMKHARKLCNKTYSDG